MNMPIKFDTLSYARKLEEAGLPQQQAEAQSLALRDALAESTVTPGDMLLLKTDLIARLEILRSDVYAQIEKLRCDLQRQIDELKAHMNIRFNILYMVTGLSLVLHGVTLGVLFKILSRLP
ncbi:MULTISPECIES: hypothetical protein [unclassified Duganella]|uniref:hypothetical protein n=1 Tax=unclassified Duganella TaxID=2636909 RepID=UPI000E3456DA|nr:MULTISPECIES: hypothetical protein [unclassified Duganella]RFP12966.1 hypothetical protein D0T23_17955 [Duganella sp. BJB475]RFP28975.1 hypothetical protein D0T21_21940 [Duganella sp. BJB476]